MEPGLSHTEPIDHTHSWSRLPLALGELIGAHPVLSDPGFSDPGVQRLQSGLRASRLAEPGTDAAMQL